MNHKGNWLGTFWMNEEKLTRVRFEPATSGLTEVAGSTPALVNFSLFIQIFYFIFFFVFQKKIKTHDDKQLGAWSMNFSLFSGVHPQSV